MASSISFNGGTSGVGSAGSSDSAVGVELLQATRKRIKSTNKPINKLAKLMNQGKLLRFILQKLEELNTEYLETVEFTNND